MRRIRSLLLIFFAVATLTGCVTTGPKVASLGGEGVIAPLESGKARIFVYRTGNPFLLALTPQVIINDQAVGRSQHGAVFFRDAEPGRYKVFLADDPDNLIYLILRAGDEAFIKVEPLLEVPRSRLVAFRVNPVDGHREIVGLALNDGLAITQ